MKYDNPRKGFEPLRGLTSKYIIRCWKGSLLILDCLSLYQIMLQGVSDQ